MDKKFSILINSCDKYSDAWPMFFHLLKANWNTNFPYIYLNTESKTYQDEHLRIKMLNSLSDYSTKNWGSRLLDCLERIQSEYILMMLEDFYYESQIDVSTIGESIEYLDNHPEIAAIQYIHASECFKTTPNAQIASSSVFIKRPKFGKFKIVAGPSMWRKSDLMKLTKRNDSPWDWEYFGSYRTYFYGQHFYCLANKEHTVFEYDIAHGGAIHRGKWVGYKMRELEKKYNFTIDYGDREIEEDWMEVSDFIQPSLPVYKRLNSIISNRLKIVTNVLYGLKLRRKRENK